MNNEQKFHDESRYALVEYDGTDPLRAADYDGPPDEFFWGSVMGYDNLGFECDVDLLR